MKRAIVFDVNETLLDLKSLDPIFERLFGNAERRREWFTQMLQTAFVSTIIGSYASFAETGQAALSVLAQRHGHQLIDTDRDELAHGMTHLAAYPEVADSLRQLKQAGFSIASLTNSTLAVVEQQLTQVGLRDLFDHVLSADEVRRLKPAPEPYLFAAERLSVSCAQIRMVAAHGWDIAGATNAGCATAFVARPGQFLDPLVPAPEIVGADLHEVIARIIEVDQPRD